MSLARAGITPSRSNGEQPQARSSCALAALQHIARAALEQGQGQSLEGAQQNCQHQKGFCTKSSNDLTKNHTVVFVEDLCIRNMSKSGRGSEENEGKIVEQKSGLNGETRGKSLPSGPSESEGSQEMAETPAVLSTESPGPPAPVDRGRDSHR